jgi:hypothetical protein
MATTVEPFAQWLAQAGIVPERLTAAQDAVLQAAFRYRQQAGTDYYATRLLGHVLLHCQSGLPVAQIARLLGLSRPTASRQQGVSAKEVVQSAHHRMAGRSHGKLLPRYAGPIAEFVLTHPQATRYDTLDFIERTWEVRVSTVALHKFLKKYGLDRASREAATRTAPPPPAAEAQAGGPSRLVLAAPLAAVPPGQPVPLPAPPFSSPRRTTRAPSCCCRRPWTGCAPPRPV